MNYAPVHGLIILFAAICMLLVLCGNANASDMAAKNSSGEMSQTSNDDSADSGESENQALLAAGKTALKKLPDSTVIGIESEHNGDYWEVEVAFRGGERKKLHVSADGNRIVRGPRGSEHDEKSKAKWRRRLQTVKLDYVQGYEKAVSARKGRVTELEIDDHHDHIVWEADVKADGVKYEVKVDARNGEVLKNERD